MKPYYRYKGKFKDGRKRVVIDYEEDGKIKSKNIPKPEELLKQLDRSNPSQIPKEIREGF